MAQQLTFSPEIPNHVQLVDLGGRSYSIQVIWKERLSGWYMDVRLPDGTDVSLGARIAPGGLVVADTNRWDSASEHGGVLVATGKDPYAREDLGQVGGVNVAFFPREDFDEYLATLAAAGQLNLLVTP